MEGNAAAELHEQMQPARATVQREEYGNAEFDDGIHIYYELYGKGGENVLFIAEHGETSRSWCPMVMSHAISTVLSLIVTVVIIG